MVARDWQIIERYGVTIYYTAPVLVRTFMKWGRAILDAHDLTSLRVLGSCGEPINPAAWRWYGEVIGGNKAPVMDTWWQTETGAIMISPLPGVTATKPGAAMASLPGISAKVVDEEDNQLQAAPRYSDGPAAVGYLVLDKPWPSMLRGIWGDSDRYRATYWEKFPGAGWYFTGDGAKLDRDGDLWLLGRVDDVMNVSGHRISTAEVESALVGHYCVAKAAVAGATDSTTGQGIVAFVILTADSGRHDLIEELKSEVSRMISPIAQPREIHVVPELRKTRSGKIMRRLLRDIAEGREIGDTSTVVDPDVPKSIRAGSK